MKIIQDLKKHLEVLLPAMLGVFLLVLSLFFLFSGFKGDRERTLAHFGNLSLLMKQELELLFPDQAFEQITIRLNEFMMHEPDMVYFVLTDADGFIQVSDNPEMLGKKHFETAEILQVTRPLMEITGIKVVGRPRSRLVIYESRMTRDVEKEEGLRAEKDQVVYDCFQEVFTDGKRLGTLRVGFSKDQIQSNLFYIAMLMLGSSMAVLSGVSAVAGCRRKRRLKMIQAVVESVERIHLDPDPPGLRDHPLDTAEIRRLKTAITAFREKLTRQVGELESFNREMDEQREQALKAYQRIGKEYDRQSREHRELETRLLNAQKLEAVGTLAGGVAHEFNNLFMAITGYASLIQRQSEKPQANIERADKILKLVDTGSQSVKQLLGFAKSGKYTPGQLNMNEVIRTNLEMFKKTRKDLLIQAKYTSGIWNVYADRSQMDHVIMNLLINASEAMPSEGIINIETSNIVLEKRKVGMNKVVSGKFVRCSVQDQGKGIETKYLRRIFDPFFTTKPLSAGAGLGLASVYGIVDNHDGFTTVETATGKGSVFNIFLPAIKEEKREPDAPEPI